MNIRKSNSTFRLVASELVDESIGDFLANRSKMAVPLGELCRLHGVTEISYEPMKVEGYLVKTEDGCAIRVNSNRHKYRKRFTVAHELAHILVANRNGEDIQLKCRSKHFSSDEETLVDMVAAEILLPRNELLHAIRNNQFRSWELVNYLHHTYQVSYTATIRRLLDLPEVVGIWLAGNGASYLSMSGWGSNSVLQVEHLNQIWRDFCWEGDDGKKSEVEIRTCDSRISLTAELKIMTRMGSRLKAGAEPNNRWILGWMEKPRPKTQQTFYFL